MKRRAPLACPTCGGELTAIGPDGAHCIRGHFVPRDPDGRLLAQRDGPDEMADAPADGPAGGPATTATTATAGPAPDETGAQRRQRQSQAARLVALADAHGVALWHTPDGEPWGTIAVAGHHEHWPLAARAFRTWLQRVFYEAHGELAHHQAVADAIDVLAGRALFAGPTHEVHVRIAQHGDALYLDLADNEVTRKTSRTGRSSPAASSQG